jgi:hypothetical protein
MSDITEKFDKMGIIIKIEESNDCYYCNVFRNGKMVEIPFKYYETPEDAFDETVDLIRYMVLNELKERFHNASQYHLKESEKYKFVESNKFKNHLNYHLGISFGYGYAERELDNVIKELYN